MKLLTIIAVTASIFALSACNTIQGAGRDLERAGQEIEEAADG